MNIKAKYRNNTTTLELHLISKSALTNGQARRATEFGATHIFRTNDIKSLPKYVDDEIERRGIKYIKIGHTSYKSTTWGAIVPSI